MAFVERVKQGAMYGDYGLSAGKRKVAVSGVSTVFFVDHFYKFHGWSLTRTLNVVKLYVLFLKDSSPPKTMALFDSTYMFRPNKVVPLDFVKSQEIPLLTLRLPNKQKA